MIPLRVGQGFDLHRLVPEKKLILGGIPIESPVGTVAHSDGDVLLHALVDALLGAAGLGDIGDYFPPSNPQYQNMPSTHFVETILPLLAQHQWQVVNVDATVILEAPKLVPYKQQIRQNVAQLLGLPLEAVSMKAKTMEGLPPIGTQEAIAAMVTVLLSQLDSNLQ